MLTCLRLGRQLGPALAQCSRPTSWSGSSASGARAQRRVSAAPPSPLTAYQRPYRIQLSRAKRNLHGAGPRAIGSLSILQAFTAFLQFIGEHYSATGQDQLVFFETNDRMSTRDWKAVSAALDRNQPTRKFSSWNPNYGENPLADRSSGIGPVHCIEP
jgi:hypothetical protein